MNENWTRLNAVIKWAGMTANFFAHHIGLPCGENLYQIKRGNNGISRDVAERIVLKFPDISKAWLLTGEGSMFATASTTASQIPFYNLDAEVALNGEQLGEPQFRMFVPQVGDCDIALVYNGRAMGKITPAGTIIFLKRTDVDAIIPGDEYVVVGKKFTALRKVRKIKNSPDITLVAGDRKAFDDMEIAKEDIVKLYHVVGKLSVNN
ncbi:MAG: hypothetical protein IJA66_00355 [Alistipes sp.]|nr:hypothetical protein [Alistipes sp.]